MMENERWKMKNEQCDFERRNFFDFHNSFSADKTCAACGSEITGETARFCNVCGKLLLEEYQPLDNLRASYRLQGKSFDFEVENEKNLFEQQKNAAAQTAWACFVYSLVPYLGILFVPLTFGISCFGYFNAVREPNLGGKRLSLASFYLSFIVLTLQIFLWWLLSVASKIPTL